MENSDGGGKERFLRQLLVPRPDFHLVPRPDFHPVPRTDFHPNWGFAEFLVVALLRPLVLSIEWLDLPHRKH